MDVITGQVIFETIHKRARGPVHVIHCENWVVVSTLDRFRKAELINR